MKQQDYLMQATWFLPFRIILSWAYGGLVWLRNTLYDHRLLRTVSIKTPVISVGNISVGGSGKTVLVQALIQYFLDRRMTPAVLSRGYGRSTKGLFIVSDKEGLKGTPDTGGDEPYLMALNYPDVPIVVAEDRASGAHYLEQKYGPDVILLDDGFQHRRLERTIDILILDRPDNTREHLLPWGYLREPGYAQNRADVVVYSKAGLSAQASQNLDFELASEITDVDGKKTALSTLKGTIGLFAGIGNPQHFFKTVGDLLDHVSATLAFPDHVEYSSLRTRQIAALECDILITTQKDFVKLDPGFCRANNLHYIMLKASLPQRLAKDLKQHFR